MSLLQKPTVAPYICVEDCESFWRFLSLALGAKTIERRQSTAGKMYYALLDLQGSLLRIQEAWDRDSITSTMLYVYVDNARASAKRALAYGAKKQDMGGNLFDEPDAVVKDKWNNLWWFAESTAKPSLQDS